MPYASCAGKLMSSSQSSRRLPGGGPNVSLPRFSRTPCGAGAQSARLMCILVAATEYVLAAALSMPLPSQQECVQLQDMHVHARVCSTVYCTE